VVFQAADAATSKCPAGGAHDAPAAGEYFMISEVAPADAITIKDDFKFNFVPGGAEVQSTAIGPGDPDCLGNARV
jgi:hypothetical protein